MKLRIMRPAPTSNVVVSASSVSTMAVPNRRTRGLPALLLPPSFKTCVVLVLETCSAGASPNSIAVSTQIAAA